MYSSIKIARFELKMAFPDMSYEARIYIHLENKFCVFVWIVDACWIHKSWENIGTMVSLATTTGLARGFYIFDIIYISGFTRFDLLLTAEIDWNVSK